MLGSFTPASALVGGALIGIAASLLLLTHGRVTGISGILGGLLAPVAGDIAWRGWFVAGLLLAGAAAAVLSPEALVSGIERSLGTVAAAGLLVGFGTRLGNGCTSGHGVCGISRLSGRSMVATAAFMAAGALTVLVVRHMPGGAP